MHPLSAFSGGSHTCQAKLQQLKERRAARRVPSSPAVAAVASGGNGGDGDEQAPSVSDALSWQGSLQQAQQAVLSGSVPHADDVSEMLALLSSPPPSLGAPTLSPGSTSYAAALQLAAPTSSAWPVPSPVCASVEVKLPSGGSPAAALPARGMHHHLLAAFGLTLVGEASASQPASAAQLFGAVRPGCTLLTIDACLLSPPAADGVLANAARIACALYDTLPALFAKQPAGTSVGVVLRSNAAAYSSAQLLLRAHEAVAVLSPSPSPTPPSLKVCPLAILSTADAAVLLSGGSSNLFDCAVHVRLNGQYLPVEDCASDGNNALRLTLPASNVDGCACLDVEPRAASPEGVHAPLTHCLLCTDAAVVKEVTDSAEAADALPPGPVAEAHHAALQRAVWALGCALSTRSAKHVAARTPRSDRRCLAALGAAAAIRFGWSAALDACLALLEDVTERDVTFIGGSSGATLLHQAVQAGAGPMLDSVLSASPSVRGRASAPNAHGATPLHLAARAGCWTALEALCCITGGAERKADAASAVVAFVCAHDNAGATPAQLAIEAALQLPNSDAVLLQACVERLRYQAAAGAQAVNVAAAAAATASSNHGYAVSMLHLFELVDAQLVAVGDLSDLRALDAHLIGKSLLRQLDTALDAHASSTAVVSADPVVDPLTGLTDVRVLSLIACAIIAALQYICCALSRMKMAPFPDETIRTFLPVAPWYVWLRMPTSMCCTGHHGVFFIVRCAVTLCAFAVTLAVAVQGRNGATRARLKPSHLASAHLMLLAYFWILDPVVCGWRTNLRYAGISRLRQPWQGGLRQLLSVLSMHAASGTHVPPTPYSALLLLRGVLPLLVRAAETGPAVFEPLARLRLLPDNLGWDLLHVTATVLCVAHTAAMGAHGRRRRKLCQGSDACAADHGLK